jgi:hypothetical protein
VFIGGVNEFREGAGHRFENLRELGVLFVLPRLPQLYETALKGRQLRLKIRVEPFQLECETAQFFGVRNCFRHGFFLPPLKWVLTEENPTGRFPRPPLIPGDRSVREHRRSPAQATQKILRPFTSSVKVSIIPVLRKDAGQSWRYRQAWDVGPGTWGARGEM